MAEILLEGRDCEACGTEVRKGALFCYYCGASVAPDIVVTTDLDKEKVSDEWFREDVTESVAKDEEIKDDSETIEETDEPETVIDESEIAEEPEKAVSGEDKIIEDKAVIEKDSEEETDKKPKLETAAAMRRKPKRIQKKRVEIVWEEPVSPPNVWFLITTILFAALAVGLWFVAKYLG